MHNYKIATDQKLIFLQMNGDFSARDLVSFIAEVSRDRDYDPSFNSIVDLQNSASIIPAQEAQSVIEAATMITGQASAKSAVVTSSVFRKNIVDMAGWLSKSKHVEIRGFTNLTEACNWLQIDAKKLQIPCN